jgi:hypothetical protein
MASALALIQNRGDLSSPDESGPCGSAPQLQQTHRPLPATLPLEGEWEGGGALPVHSLSPIRLYAGLN